MPEFIYRNVNDAFEDQINRFRIFQRNGKQRDATFAKTPSRDGDVIRYRCPVTMTYTHPRERVLFNPFRDANPFFHLFEAVWMLAGKEDLASVQHFVSTFGRFSDDGKTLNGAYGYRWRHYFGYDQLDWIIDELKNNPTSRRCVLQMWDGGRTYNHSDPSTTGSRQEPVEGSGDLYKAFHGSADVPCNLCVLFEVEDVVDNPDTMHSKHRQVLNMTVMNRSNDLVWGALGANYVHFTVLQEYIANRAGYDLGVYNQVVNNLHVYTGDGRVDLAKLSQPFSSQYSHIRPVRIDSDSPVFDEAARLGAAVCNSERPYDSQWMQTVFRPAMLAHHYHKQGDSLNSVAMAGRIASMDWREACTGWLQRRYRNPNFCSLEA